MSTLLWISVAAVGLVASAIFHTQTPLARRIVRDQVNSFVNGEILGRLEISHIESMTAAGIVCRNTSVYDPDGRRVIWGERVFLVIDYQAAIDQGVLRFSHARLNNGFVHLISNDEDEPTFLDAFASRTPSIPGAVPFHAIVDDVHLEEVTVHGTLLGLEGLRIENMNVHGKMDFFYFSDFRIWSAHGDIVEPFPFDARLDQIVGRVSTQGDVGARLFARAHKGDEELRANFVYAQEKDAAPEDPERMRLELHASPIHAQSIRDVGFEWADILTGQIRGYLSLDGLPQDLALRAHLASSGGPVRLEGRVVSGVRTQVNVQSTGVNLGSILEGFPYLQVAGSVELIDKAGVDDVFMQLDLEAFEYLGVLVPSLSARTAIEDDALRVEEVHARQAGAHIRGGGRVSFDGKTKLRLRGRIPNIAAEPNLRAVVPGLRGGLEVDLRFDSTGGDDPRLNLRGSYELRNLRYGPLTANKLSISGSVSGTTRRPSVHLSADARGVTLYQFPIGNGQARVDGDPGTYRAQARFTGKRSRLAFFTRVRARGRDFLIQGEQFEIGLDDQVWSGNAPDLVFRPGVQLSLGEVAFASGDQRLNVQGVWRFHGDDEIQVELTRFDLGVAQRLLAPHLPNLVADGRAELHLVLSGDIDQRPQVLAEGALYEGSIMHLKGINAQYRVHLEESGIRLDLLANVFERGSFQINGTGMLDTEEPNLSDALLGGVYEVKLVGNDLDLAVIKDIGGGRLPAPKFDGRATVELHASGPIDAPDIDGTVNIPALKIPGWPILSLKTGIRYQSGALLGRVVVGDALGELVEAQGSLLTDLYSWTQDVDAALAALDASPWRFSARAPPRLLSEYPEPLAEKIPELARPLNVGASITLAGGAFQTKGDFHSSFDWTGDLHDELCAQNARPRGQIIAHLEEGETSIILRGLVGRRRVLELKASAATPIGQWLSDPSSRQPPETHITAELKDAPAEEIPIVCRYASGPIDGRLELIDMFTENPQARVSLSSDALRIRRLYSSRDGRTRLSQETKPFGLRIEDAYVDSNEARAEATLRWENAGFAETSIRVPMQWDEQSMLPQVNHDGAFDLHADFSETPLRALLTWFPPISDSDGLVEGYLTASGTLANPDFSGSFDLHEGQIEVDSLGQRLVDARGTILMEGDRIVLQGLRARDGRGAVTLAGEIGLTGLQPTRSLLRIQANNFPVRQEGSVIARLRGDATLTAKISPEELNGSLVVNDLNVRLPDDPGNNPQTLDAHPDLRVQGEEKRDAIDPSAYRISFDVDAKRPFWVRGSDFAAQTVAELRVTYQEPELHVGGEAQIRRGFFEVFGKRFDVERANMVFNEPDDQVNPNVSLVATHELRNQPGQTVTVTATGRLSNPVVRFSTTVPVDDESQIIALLLTGDTRVSRTQQPSTQQDASQQTADFLAGIVAGVLTLSLREEFGEFIPVIAVETGEAGYRSARVRAGFDIDRAVPKRLRNVVQGAYIEGFFGGGAYTDGQGNNTTGQIDDLGFLLELQFPKNFVGTGTYSYPNNWSLDFTYEP